MLASFGLFCNGESTLNDRSYKNKFEFLYRLAKHTSKIKVFEGLKDLEPCQIVVSGVANEFNSFKIEVKSIDSLLPLIILGLGFQNDLEILTDYDVNNIFENLIEKVVKLGGNLHYESN